MLGYTQNSQSGETGFLSHLGCFYLILVLRFHHHPELNETVFIIMAMPVFQPVIGILSCRHKFSALPVLKSSVQKKTVEAAGPEGASCSCCWSCCALVIR